MKEFLQNLIASKEARMTEIKQLINESQNINEVRSLGKEKETVEKEISAARSQLSSLESNAFNPMNTLGQFNPGDKRSAEEDPLSTMEYRKAFKNYVQKGINSELLQKRADAGGTSTDLGILIPNTIVQEVIKGVEKVYGQIYSRVKKTNLPGGIQYPIGAFLANLVWGGTAGTDTEHGVSEKQDAGGVTGNVTFTYHIGEIRIAQSLLQSILSVPVFEAEIVKALVDAYVKAMDVAIFDGTGTNQPTGIFANVAAGIQRIAAGNIIEFSASDMADWTKWKTKLFAKIPLSMRKLRPEFAMTSNTFEANIETLKDSNGQPVARNIYNPVNGDETARFNGREVVFVEEGTSIKNFDDATANQYFGIYWVPERAYGVNTNMQFGYKKYFDEDTNQWITKGLVIVDGKILDPKYIYLLKKVV